MEFCVDKHQLRKALAKIEMAEKNGFSDSLAVFRLKTAGETLDDFQCAYSAVILRAHPTDDRLNWGRVNDPEWYKCENGQILDLPIDIDAEVRP